MNVGESETSITAQGIPSVVGLTSLLMFRGVRTVLIGLAGLVVALVVSPSDLRTLLSFLILTGFMFSAFAVINRGHLRRAINFATPLESRAPNGVINVLGRLMVGTLALTVVVLATIPLTGAVAAGVATGAGFSDFVGAAITRRWERRHVRALWCEVRSWWNTHTDRLRSSPLEPLSAPSSRVHS